jgi:hypothetical protein
MDTFYIYYYQKLSFKILIMSTLYIIYAPRNIYICRPNRLVHLKFYSNFLHYPLTSNFLDANLLGNWLKNIFHFTKSYKFKILFSISDSIMEDREPGSKKPLNER